MYHFHVFCYAFTRKFLHKLYNGIVGEKYNVYLEHKVAIHNQFLKNSNRKVTISGNKKSKAKIEPKNISSFNLE